MTTPGTTIPLDVAMTRVEAWLTTLSEISVFKENPDQIPRAIFISFKDIDQLRSDCDNMYPDDVLTGIRVYFGLAEQGGGPASVYDLRGLIVPVLKVEQSACGADAVHRDKNDPDPNNTNIYDFTTPCPRYCDYQSELYLVP